MIAPPTFASASCVLRGEGTRRSFDERTREAISSESNLYLIALTPMTSYTYEVHGLIVAEVPPSLEAGRKHASFLRKRTIEPVFNHDHHR